MGSGFTKSCPKCGYEYHSSTGVGFMFPLVYAETVQKAKAGELGEELQQFSKEHKDGAINARYVDLCCEDCGHLSGGMDLTMYIPNEKKPEKIKHRRWSGGRSHEDVVYVDQYDLAEFYTEYAKYPHKCEKCAGKMTAMEDDAKLVCPKCKIPLETTGHIMWD